MMMPTFTSIGVTTLPDALEIGRMIDPRIDPFHPQGLTPGPSPIANPPERLARLKRSDRAGFATALARHRGPNSHWSGFLQQNRPNAIHG